MNIQGAVRWHNFALSTITLTYLQVKYVMHFNSLHLNKRFVIAESLKIYVILYIFRSRKWQCLQWLHRFYPSSKFLTTINRAVCVICLTLNLGLSARSSNLCGIALCQLTWQLWQGSKTHMSKKDSSWLFCCRGSGSDVSDLSGFRVVQIRRFYHLFLPLPEPKIS